MEIGQVCRRREFIGRHPILSPQQVEVSVLLYCHLLPVGLCISDVTYYSSKLQFMLALIEHSPDIYLDEIQEQLLERHDVKLTR